MMKNSNGVHYNPTKKKKVLFILGATATGKSRLSIDIATHFPAQIINSDKIQVYKGFDIVTNKMHESQRRGVPHHLLGFISNPDADFTVHEFCHYVETTINDITQHGCIPIITGGSNSYIKALVEDSDINFRSKYDCCFLWVDVSLPVLFEYIGRRVDQMVEDGLVEEIREMFKPGADYSRGIRRAIGIPELEKYFLVEKKLNEDLGGDYKEALLRVAIEETKINTCKLVFRQLEKIHRMKNELSWEMHRIETTAVIEKYGKERTEELWNKLVLKPSLEIMDRFLKRD
ncbi:adenylate isopentenyltransferase 5, chloroplastic [Ziziphus jujuba]|uniref:adenylate dimethylallyltransferase (ADP/ATP-dependent) n=2 Tax=Ziziphus jujuba TaxID=326968 RepID=A0A6P3YY11_ZIZJJ|nr:adenylate isopentenyltransferase 5, chloroplastic [Ziziphus jujuba]KAH7517877.1 hypothetical protein FEM48_Zijuj09G0110600 [Ziziphus jujuba var. spinosa]